MKPGDERYSGGSCSGLYLHASEAECNSEHDLRHQRPPDGLWLLGFDRGHCKVGGGGGGYVPVKTKSRTPVRWRRQPPRQPWKEWTSASSGTRGSQVRASGPGSHREKDSKVHRSSTPNRAKVSPVVLVILRMGSGHWPDVGTGRRSMRTRQRVGRVTHQDLMVRAESSVPWSHATRSRSRAEARVHSQRPSRKIVIVWSEVQGRT